MFTYEYYWEAFPVRNQVCDFWEVLKVWQWGRNDGSLLQSCPGCLQADGKIQSWIAQRSFLYPTYFGNPSLAGEAPRLSQSWVGSSSATSALLWWQLLSVILQSCLLRLPLASGTLEGPDPCVC